MLITHKRDIPFSEVTPRHLYVNRREFLMTGSAVTLGVFAGHLAGGDVNGTGAEARNELLFTRNAAFSTDEKVNSLDDVTSYNNFYEFGLGKGDPARYAHEMTVRPWTVRVEGEMRAPAAEYALDDILKPHALEERIYRLRCVEAWSMVVPWIGFPLRDLIKRFEPTSNARWVRFTTLYRPNELRGQRRTTLRWPYVEGLRMDEALHPLTLIAVGLYGETLPNQNGAPLRLVVPWKYGFKSIKSIVKIEFVKTQPKPTWNLSAPREYGFYANVNPQVDHPRWSQASERRIGRFFRQKTRMFNGYADEVGHLYAGMDLTRQF